MISEDLKASTKHAWSRKAWYANILIPLLTLLPLWFRFNQCLRRYTDTGKRFPHLANACKYALSQTVTLFGAFHPLYMRNKKESEIFQLFWKHKKYALKMYKSGLNEQLMMFHQRLHDVLAEGKLNNIELKAKQVKSLELM